MPCNSPIQGYRSKAPTENGKHKLVFNKSEAQQDETLDVPCGMCLGCRQDLSRDWELRMIHEQKCHKKSCFITLTYDAENLPFDGGLRPDHWRLFMMRLRKRIYPIKIRFVMGAEYGEKRLKSDIPWLTNDGDRLLGRPHYHAIIYGYDFPDKKHVSTRKGNFIYTSQLLEECWPHGKTEIGEANNTTARYTIKYVYKQLKGDSSTQYKRIHPETGEEYPIQPEFRRSSRNPGIGEPWFMKYSQDLHKGFCTVDGKKYRIPRYYMKLMDKHYDTSFVQETIANAKAVFKPSGFDEEAQQFADQRRVESVRAYRNEKIRKDL